MNKQSSSYKQIIKSTSIFGGVQVINIIIGIIRNKFVAILLGRAGIGMISIYQSIIDVIRAICGLGIDTGAIRDIAAHSKDKEKQAETISIFRWWVIVTSLLSSFVCIVLCYPISLWAFGDDSHVLPIAFLSICIFFTSLSMGQTVIMQGMRKISSMAISGVLGNFAGLVIMLPLYFFFGFKGIIPSLILASICLLYFTSRYVKKIDFKRIKVENSIAFHKGLQNLKLGLFVVGASVVNTSSMFFVRSFINNSVDIEAVGVFQATWTITSVNIMLILKAMGTDFFPRLCSVVDNDFTIRRLVNQQTYIATVIAIPVIVLMLSFSGIVLNILYTGEFIAGTSVLQWQIAGSFFKILSWPMAFILLAKGKGLHFLLSETIYFAVYVACSYFLFPVFGLNAVGMAYFISYVIYLVVIFMYAINLCKFRWSKQNLNIAIVGLLFIGCSIFFTKQFSDYQIIIGIFMVVLSVIFTFRMLNKIFDMKDIIMQIKDKIFPKK